jgi:uncharacterized protein GlcG (DUF336 family)
VKKNLRRLISLPFLLLGVAAAIVACTNQASYPNPANLAASGQALTAADVDQILVAAVSQANASGLPSVVAVTDREGEVLGVFVMKGRDVNGDGIIDNLGEGDIQGAIAKAATVSAFQSEQEAFTTRTAFFIVQGHYPPNVLNQAGGPLFGVQDSGQPNTDGHSVAYDQSGTPVGTGISGVYGGVPLYKQGAPVGGIGVQTVSVLVSQSSSLDPTLAPTLVNGVQKDSDELIARAGAHGFEAPQIIQATNLFVGGLNFPFYGLSIPTNQSSVAATTTAISASIGAVDPRFPVRASGLPAETRSGNQFGFRAAHRYKGRLGARASAVFSGTFTNVDLSPGVTFDPATLRYTNIPIVPLTQTNLGGTQGEFRYPPIDSIEPPPSAGGLTAGEVQQILADAASEALLDRAAIRLPRGVNVVIYQTVVDARGNILGAYRMGDATHFSFDIAIEKARTAAFFSTDGTTGGLQPLAITPRAIGFMAQPFFPPGLSLTEPGPFARLRDLLNRGKITEEVPPSLTLITPPPRLPSDGTTDENPLVGGFQRFNDFPGGVPVELGAVRGIVSAIGGIAILQDRPDVGFISPGMQNGIMTFPGGAPLYKNSKLVGAVGCSGDGVDEDDQSAFAGAGNFQPPAGIRCDEVPESQMIPVLKAKVQLLVSAIQAHPDPRIRNVYGPEMVAEQSRINDRFSRGLSNVTIPYIKFSRNPTER